MTTDTKDGWRKDQETVFSRLMDAVAQLGDVQAIIARSLLDVAMPADHKLAVSVSLASAINSMNRASHLVMRATIEDPKAAPDRPVGHH